MFRSAYVIAVVIVATIFDNASAAISNGSPTTSMTTPCGSELRDICGMPYPNTYQGVFNARLCLWANQDQLSAICVDYLLHHSPSIVEPCYDQVIAHCKSVIPGDNRIHKCLMANAANELSPECRAVVYRDQETQSEQSGPSSSIDDASLTSFEIQNSAELETEYSYIMEHVQHKMEQKKQLVSQLADVFVFQSLLSHMAKSSVLSSLGLFINHINNDLALLENRIFAILQVPASDDLQQEEESEVEQIVEKDFVDASEEDMLADDDVDFADDEDSEEKVDRWPRPKHRQEKEPQLSAGQVGRAMDQDDYFTFEKLIQARSSDMMLQWLEQSTLSAKETIEQASERFNWLFSPEAGQQAVPAAAAQPVEREKELVTWEDSLHADSHLFLRRSPSAVGEEVLESPSAQGADVQQEEDEEVIEEAADNDSDDEEEQLAEFDLEEDEEALLDKFDATPSMVRESSDNNQYLAEWAKHLLVTVPSAPALRGSRQ